jgi:hypothetical protein
MRVLHQEGVFDLPIADSAPLDGAGREEEPSA